MKKFKLIQILPSLRSGGVEQGTLDVANYLASLEFKNYICSNGGDMLSYLNKKYVEHLQLPVNSKFFINFPFLAKKLNSTRVKTGTAFRQKKRNSSTFQKLIWPLFNKKIKIFYSILASIYKFS